MTINTLLILKNITGIISATPKHVIVLNPLSAKFIKWSNTLKQIVGKLPTICLSVFGHFSGLAFKGLIQISNDEMIAIFMISDDF